MQGAVECGVAQRGRKSCNAIAFDIDDINAQEEYLIKAREASAVKALHAMPGPSNNMHMAEGPTGPTAKKPKSSGSEK